MMILVVARHRKLHGGEVLLWSPMVPEGGIAALGALASDKVISLTREESQRPFASNLQICV
jgi:hypothetical protein